MSDSDLNKLSPTAHSEKVSIFFEKHSFPICYSKLPVDNCQFSSFVANSFVSNPTSKKNAFFTNVPTIPF